MFVFVWVLFGILFYCHFNVYEDNYRVVGCFLCVELFKAYYSRTSIAENCCVEKGNVLQLLATTERWSNFVETKYWIFGEFSVVQQILATIIIIQSISLCVHLSIFLAAQNGINNNSWRFSISRKKEKTKTKTKWIHLYSFDILFEQKNISTADSGVEKKKRLKNTCDKTWVSTHFKPKMNELWRTLW